MDAKNAAWSIQKYYEESGASVGLTDVRFDPKDLNRVAAWYNVLWLCSEFEIRYGQNSMIDELKVAVRARLVYTDHSLLLSNLPVLLLSEVVELYAECPRDSLTSEDQSPT